MNLTATIVSAEHQFKQILEGFFINNFDDNSLSSHGIEHHRRVWNFAKQLMLLLGRHNMISDPAISSGLIISCYLHDIGMSVDPGIRHGHHSREICIRFLKENHLKEPDYTDVLSAIENHDRKEFYSFAGKYDLLTLLSIADDLDAFGFTGIFRYSEIYLTRGNNPKDLGVMILENADRRFENFSGAFKFSDDFFLKHKKRYDILVNFFEKYNDLVKDYQFGDIHPSGYCGVIDILINLIRNKKQLKDIYNNPGQISDDDFIIWFFNGLNSESWLR
jgi:HD superfamily phosphodiesterase